MIPDIPFSDRNLILTGYSGPNRPLVGRAVAERLRMPFIDFDQLVEQRTGHTVAELRAMYSERHLMTIESELMDELVLRRRTVLRISGSVLLHADYFERLGATGFVICLVATLDSVLQQQHLLLGARYHDPAERAVVLGYLKREWAVRKLDGVHELDTTYLDERGTLGAVLKLWQRLTLRTAR